MALFDTEAIVIGSANIGEADLLVTLFTRDHGKIKAVARGARILKSRFSGLFLPLSVLRVIYFGNEKRELYRLNSCDPVKTCDFSSGFEKLTTGCCIAEILELCCGPGEVSIPMYHLALEGIQLLNEGNQGHNLAVSFAMKAFALSGYMPHLEDCIACGGGLQGAKLRYNPARGGALCSRCVAVAGKHYPMSMGSLKFLRACLGLDLRKSSRIKLGARLQKEARDIVFNHLAYYAEREMRCPRFLEL